MGAEPEAYERVAALLNDVFDLHPPLRTSDVAWYYDANPVGSASVGRVEEGGRRFGNYALIPQEYRNEGRSLRLGLGVDLSVHPDARGGGTFRRTVEDSYERGAADGLDGILGVANAQSAPRMVKTLGWAHLPPLPVRLLALAPTSGGLVAHRADAVFLASADFDRMVPETLPVTGGGWCPVWTRDLLRWRLAKPRASYVLHISNDVVAVSTKTIIKGVRFGVLLKVFPLTGPAKGARVARAVAGHHRTPFVVHWGANRDVTLRGLPLPRNAMPSPLELVVHPFHDEFEPGSIRFSAFEFLDFDGF